MSNISENFNNLENSEKLQSVLLIDDSTDVLAIHKIVLEQAGLEVITAESGTQAISLLNEIVEPNLILLDMKMPDMSGVAFIDHLQKNKPDIIAHVPIVFLTGIDVLPKTKASGFIRKPIDITDFVKSVHKYIELGTNSSNH